MTNVEQMRKLANQFLDEAQNAIENKGDPGLGILAATLYNVAAEIAERLDRIHEALLKIEAMR